MLKIGQYNRLTINRMVDFGAYLDAGDDKEILMPGKYVDPDLGVGDEVDVFVYTDSEDRLVATTERPFAVVGEFAYLQVAEVTKVGAFLDWGLQAKQLLVPFSEQRQRMVQGGIYLVYVYLDDTTLRVVASAKYEKFVGNVWPHYVPGQKVQALVVQHAPIGYKCIVDNLHWGMVYDNETFQPLALEQTITAYVKNVRQDGKLDLRLTDRAQARTADLSGVILAALDKAGGRLPLTDKSSPDEIRRALQCSKRDFKMAVGKLYKERKIALSADGIVKI